jgi:hypothetical protein
MYIVTNLLDKETQSVKRQFALLATIDVLQTKLTLLQTPRIIYSIGFYVFLMAYITTPSADLTLFRS